MKITKVRDVKTPQRANSTDAGLDFFVPNDFFKTYIEPGGSLLIPSGIKASVLAGSALLAFNKSGVATKKHLTIGACVVDAGYQGEIHIHVFNVGKTTQSIDAGEKLVQFILLPIISEDVEVVETEEELFDSISTRGAGGFGSTGTK